MLQDMVWILAQLEVSGQQRPEDELSRDIQLSPEGQRKLLGSLGSTVAEHDTELARLANVEKDVPDIMSASRAEVEDMIVVPSHNRRRVKVLDGGRMMIRVGERDKMPNWTAKEANTSRVRTGRL